MIRSAAFCLLSLALTSIASASIQVAVFGDNAIDDFINGSIPNATATLVTDGQLATAGFLNGFDAFLYTRNSSFFSTSLSPQAAANVASYVGATGNVALFNGDFADAVGASAFVDGLFTNAVQFAAASGNGFIGEFGGTFAAFDSNTLSLTPLGLISGDAGIVNNQQAAGAISLTPPGITHPITQGLSFPSDPDDVGVGAALSGIDPALVLATFPSGNPAIIARGDLDQPTVPEPSMLLVWSGLACCSALALRRGCRRA